MPKKKAAVADGRMTPQQIMDEINSVIPGAVTTGSHEDMEVRRWPTGVAPLDYALDGGLPRGRFIEVYGPYSVLKSWWAYKSIAAVQAAGGRCGLVDTEHSWDPEWGARLGVNVDDLLVIRPDNAEDAILSLQALINQKYDLLVFDSIAAAVPNQIATARPGEDTAPGALARVMSRGLARLTAANKHTTVFCINQTREKIGVSFGSPTTTSGGKAMGYYASYRISFVRVGKIRVPIKKWDGEKMADSQQIVAHKIKATLEKSKLSAPNEDVVFLYDLQEGEVDEVNWLIGQALEAGLVIQKGAYYDVPGVLDKPIQGRDKFVKWVKENPEVSEWIKEGIMPEFKEASA